MPAAFKKPEANSKELKLDSVVRLLEGCLDDWMDSQADSQSEWKLEKDTCLILETKILDFLENIC